jgi:hypothetical protein
MAAKHDDVDGSLSTTIGGIVDSFNTDPPNDPALEQRQKALLLDGTGKWRYNAAIPHLRLILCLIEDDIQPKFMRRDYGLKSDDTVLYELIADRWNSDTFNPILPSSNVHTDFQQPSTDCSYAKVAGLTRATARTVEDHISSMRANLIQIIIQWESDGQCDSVTLEQRQQQIRRGYPVFGKLGGRTAAALQTRANFLHNGTMPSYLLILWELADEHGLLPSILQRLANGVGAPDASSAPLTVGVVKKRHRGSGRSSYSGIITNLSKTLKTYNVDYSMRNVLDQLSHLNDQKRKYRLQQFRANQSPREIEYIQEVLDSIDVEMETCQTERRRLERKKQTR